MEALEAPRGGILMAVGAYSSIGAPTLSRLEGGLVPTRMGMGLSGADTSRRYLPRRARCPWQLGHLGRLALVAV